MMILFRTNFIILYLSHQDWFAQGGSPFVGMIMSPYDTMHSSSQSQLKCLTVVNDHKATSKQPGKIYSDTQNSELRHSFI